MNISSTYSETACSFGTFKVAKKAARNGRNPQSDEAIKIPAIVPKFKPGKTLNDAVNTKK